MSGNITGISIGLKQKMGHYCWMCERRRPNERFSGRGHRSHVCRECQRLPNSKKMQIAALHEMRGFLDQSHISKKNRHRLQKLCNSDIPEVRSLAVVVLDIAQVAAAKRKRYRFIKHNKSELWQEMLRHGLAWEYPVDEENMDLMLEENHDFMYGSDLDFMLDLG